MPLLIVFLAGGLGSLARYLLSLGAGALWEGAFPLGTFAINLLGCFGIGFLAGFAERIPVEANVRLLVQTGFLGGFTTFSAFGLETFQLFRRGDPVTATGYLVASTVVGLGMVFGGYVVARALVAPAPKA